MLQMQGNSILSVSPTFSSYSSSRFAEIASRVVDEINREGEENEEEFLISDAAAHLEQISLNPLQECPLEEEQISLELPQLEISVVENAGEGEEDEANEDDDDDFEFAFVPRDPCAPPISADDVFSDGQIRPIWPIFNSDLVFSESQGSDEGNHEQNYGPSIRLPMRKLLAEGRDPPALSPSSSSESVTLDEIPSGSYCVWTPRSTKSARAEAAVSPDRCKKSNSTGSSKVWRFRDLMHRSSSNGQDTMVFLSTDAIKGGEKRGTVLKEERRKEKVVVGGKKGKREVSAHEMHYLRNRMMSEGDRRRSFLPYRQDLVGFFANVNGLSRSLHPF
ncbi:uncharacterized protein LOC131237717 [Magnolia sinica]|uniref:uncharacterized protein LOC131237717 n=1 Tax=Magnolia sinica TaxID=86752 RepID=UPI002659063B|nr:uncharacterized protein LOC131237717 [Magnolia sinica]